ncbi:hypothetical protein UABAM_05349 [Candidatus Uabimicrobium amorphum]|uniref:Uncharacterized protein n=1 Tax=Uabimicrobium amorphum TaxID=2596890 RepID=A0A5S9F5K1_UABAM|nr:hypothetical protein UABAM_05349 [Candidatus Uabimicrobium amorphum]
MSTKKILWVFCIVFLLSCDNTRTNTSTIQERKQQVSSTKGKRMFLTSKKVSQNIPPLDASIPETLHTATFALG